MSTVFSSHACDHVIVNFCSAVTVVNDTAIGDPLMTVPLNIADKTSFFEASINNNIGPNDIINLCYELHGRRDAFVNLVSDECISVNAHYELVQPNEPREDINIIDNIHVRATDSIGRCRNIGVALNEGGVCTASVDGANIADMYQANGISIRRYTNRVRIMVPNCEDVNLVMWVFCRQSTFWSTFRTDNNGAELTFQADMIKFVIARGFNLRERSHGIIGESYNLLLTNCVCDNNNYYFLNSYNDPSILSNYNNYNGIGYSPCIA